MIVEDGLMKHQAAGVRWLLDNPKGMLAWQMGTGKTATALRAWDCSQEHGPLLVLCKVSGRENWRREAMRFCIDPDFPPRVQVVTHGATPIDRGADIVVSNYDKLLNRQFRLALHGPEYARRRWGALVLDEAHALKTPSAERTKFVYGGGRSNQRPLIDFAERVWPLTGTPMLNHPGELWSHAFHLWQQSLLYKGRPMSLIEFELAFCEIIQTDYGNKVVGGRNLAELKQRLAPYISRVLAKDVLDLPPLRIDSWPLDMEGVGSSFPDLPDLTASLTQKYGPLSNIDRFSNSDLDVYLACITAEKTALATIARQTGNLKAIACVVLIQEELEASGHKVAVFAQHREAIDTLVKGLKAFNPAVVHGGVPAGARRDEEIDRFNNDPTCRVFVGQNQAAGDTINLQAADHVILCECDWSPEINEQIYRRVYRNGQTKPVFVRFAYLKGSIDEAKNRALARKTAMIAQVIN